MIGRLIDIFLSCGAESVNVIVNEQMTEVREYLAGLAPTLPVEFNVKVKSTPSSMHSFAELSGIMPRRGKFVLTTVDTIFRPDDFLRYVETFGRAEADAVMAVTSYIDDEKPLYVAATPQAPDGLMKVEGFLDAPEPGVRFISGGIYGLTESSFGVLHRCLEEGTSRMRNFQRALIAGGLDVRAFDMGKILDIDHASDLEKARKFLGE